MLNHYVSWRVSADERPDISFVSVIAFSNSAFDMVTALISGASYFEYLRSKKKGEDEA